MISRYALAYPMVSLELLQDGQKIFSAQANPDPFARIVAVLGEEIADSLFPIRFEKQGVSLTGWISNPSYHRGNRAQQHFFVNLRPVLIPYLSHYLQEAYQDFLEKGEFPVAIMLWQCDPSEIDVNVHPAKREIRFRRDTEVRGMILQAVRETLLVHDSSYLKEERFTQYWQSQKSGFSQEDSGNPAYPKLASFSVFSPVSGFRADLEPPGFFLAGASRFEAGPGG